LINQSSFSLSSLCILNHSACFCSPVCGCFTSQGSHFYFEGVKLAQGRDNVLAHLKDNPDTAARLTTAVQAKIAELGALQASSSGSGAHSSSLDDDDDDGFGDELLDDDALLAELREIDG
jgi:hypothetical protein